MSSLAQSIVTGLGLAPQLPAKVSFLVLASKQIVLHVLFALLVTQLLPAWVLAASLLTMSLSLSETVLVFVDHPGQGLI